MSKKIIEIGGKRCEIDTADIREIHTYRVGDRVKILKKRYSGYESYPGVIVGIEPFEKRPTIVVAYIENVLGLDGTVSFAYIQSESEDEIIPLADGDILPNAETIKTYFDRSIEDMQKNVIDMEARRDYFLKQYGEVVGETGRNVDVNA